MTFLKGYCKRLQISEASSDISLLLFSDLFEYFALWADAKNECFVQAHYKAEDEGTTDGLWIEGRVFLPRKLFIHDGKYQGRQGLTIRDHLDLPMNVVDDVFRIADKFGEYLNEKGISYERYNMKFPECEEVLAK